MFRGLIETLSGGTWSGETAPQPSNSGTDARYDQVTKITAVSCASAAFCVAAGSYLTPNSVEGLIDTYAAARPQRPTITRLSPVRGAAKGGSTVTVTGTGFTDVTRVDFGTAAGTKVHVDSPTKLTVTSPRHAKGTVSVSVTAAGGTSASSKADRFTYT